MEGSSEARGTTKQCPLGAKSRTPRACEAVVKEPGPCVCIVALGPGGHVEGVANACTRRVDRTVTDGQEGNSGSGRRHQRGAGTRHGMLPWEGVGPLEEPINQGESLIPRRRRTPEFLPNRSTSCNPARGRDKASRSTRNLKENSEPS